MLYKSKKINLLVYQKEPEKETAEIKSSLGQNTPQRLDCKTILPEFNWISLWSNLCSWALFKTIVQLAENEWNIRAGCASKEAIE